jgi:zona occludens toxin
MINLLLGAPGGGKSYEAVVYHVLPALEEGRKVITNLPLDLDHLSTVSPDQLAIVELRHPTADNPRPFSKPEDYGDEWRHPETEVGPLYVIDEAHMALPAQGTPREVEEWYAMHRHELADVVLITQSYGKINKAIRELVQLVYRVRKNTALGDNSSYVKKVQDGIRGEVVNTSIRKYKPEYFKFYKSHTRSNKSAQEAFAKDVKPIWRHWSVYGAVAFLLVGAFMAINGALNPFGMAEVSQQKTQTMKPAVLDPNEVLRNRLAGNSPGVRRAHPENKVVTQLEAKVASLEQQIEDMENTEHPLKTVMLHIGGSLASTDKTLYYIVASQNGQKVFDTTSAELSGMGYDVDARTECLLGISYEKYQRWITCDAPRVGVKFKTGQG